VSLLRKDKSFGLSLAVEKSLVDMTTTMICL